MFLCLFFSMKNRCDTFVRGTEKGTFLYICLFPATDVFLFVETHLEVVDVGTNSSLYSRNVSVEDHCKTLPFSLSLRECGGSPSAGKKKQCIILLNTHIIKTVI